MESIKKKEMIHIVVPSKFTKKTKIDGVWQLFSIKMELVFAFCNNFSCDNVLYNLKDFLSRYIHQSLFASFSICQRTLSIFQWNFSSVCSKSKEILTSLQPLAYSKLNDPN